MRVSWRRAAVGLAVAAVVCAASRVEADPIKITGGTVGFASVDSGLDPPFGFVLTGDGLIFSGETFQFAGLTGRAGTLLDPSTLVGVSIRPFEAQLETVDGAVYHNIFPSGTLTFTAQPVMAPPGRDLGSFAFSTPFTASGMLQGFTDAAHSQPPVFSIDVTGSGTAGFSGIINGSGADSLYRSRFVDFAFEPAAGNPSATPEPATLLLLGTGLVALVARRKTP